MYETQPGRQPPAQPQVDAGKLWAGGVATAVVAALIAVVGILVVRGLLNVYMIAPKDQGAWESASALPYAFIAALGALVATALMHLLLVSTPRPTLFFGWIMFLLGVVVGVWPFTTGAELKPQIATAALNVIIVLAIWSLVSGTAHRALAPYARDAL
jgi:Family of unknown function (DUF6069)